MNAPHDHPIFGRIDPAEKDCWEATIDHAGRQIRIDLNLDSGKIDADALARVTSLIDDPSKLEKSSREAMRKDYGQSEDSMAALYRSHHRDELSEAELTTCFGTSKAWQDDIDVFLAHCKLIRIGLYPEETERCLVLDFSLGESVTQYLLVVSFDSNGKAVAVDMES
jgi:hypothetical protein